MAYAYKQIEAHDPSNPGLVAPNASVTIFEPGDPAKTPLTITTLTGEPLPNPVTVNGLGYGPAFMHATLPQVAWAGGGLTGTFESYEGMRDEAIGARTAAENAAANAAADAVVRLDELIAAGEFEGPAGPLTNLTIGTVEATPGNPLTDEIIASEITTGTATTAALSATYGPAAEGMVAAFAGRVDDRGFATLQAAVDATPAGGQLEIRRAWTITAPVTVSKAMRITAAQGGTVTTSGAGTHGFVVSANDVTFDGAAVFGTGESVAGTASAIRAVGTEAAPIRNLVVTRCTIRNFNKFGLDLASVRDFTLTNNTIENIAYAGIMLQAAVKGYVLSNTIKNITQPSGFVNSYGIAMTRNSSLSLALSPRSSDIVCSGNIIDGVAKWEGIDTHGGESLTITNNKVTNAYIGIALVPCPDEAGNEVYAPKNMIVTGNLLESGKTDGTARSGIQLIGCITTVDNVVEYASGIISDNIVRNFGTENTSTQAGIFLQATRGALVTKNRLVNSAPNGVNLNNNNQGAQVIDNTFVDTWATTTAFTSCVYVAGPNQSVTVRGNRAVRADKTATLVNNRGLFAATAATAATVSIQYGENHFKDCTLPIIDSPTTQNLTEQRMEARKLSFYPGIAPVARQAAAAAATDAATTQALANDLRAKLVTLGLIS